MKAGIVSRLDRFEALEISTEIVNYLESKGLDVLIETDTALAMELPGHNIDLGEMNADFVITVGGDGTILKTAMLLHEPDTPILGVNMGSRGFLTEIYPVEIEKALDKIINGDYFLEKSLKLSSRSSDAEGSFPDSLNEVLISSPLPSKIIDMRLSVNGKRIIEIQGDGTMVATPTGSTAYNLSAGGSIMAPEVDSIILTVVCPYSYFRSIVIPSSSHITVDLLKPKGKALVIIDGREYKALKPRSSIEIWKSKHYARFIRFKSFYNRLERRLVFERGKL